MTSLTPKQQRFIAEFLVDLNATRAARAAGYSAKTARQAGSRLLTNVDISAAVAAGQAVHLEHAAIRKQRVLEEYRRIAFSTPASSGRKSKCAESPDPSRSCASRRSTTSDQRRPQRSPASRRS